jgi:hypothetical protein
MTGALVGLCLAVALFLPTAARGQVVIGPILNDVLDIPVPILCPGEIPAIGQLDVTSVVRQGGDLFALGTLSGTCGGEPFSLPVTFPIDLDSTNGTCDILHLVLGPLDLTLLGLEVHLDQVLLDITATAAPGNLLGNLLCAVAHLLDSPGNPLGGLASHLDRILQILQGL